MTIQKKKILNSDSSYHHGNSKLSISQGYVLREAVKKGKFDNQHEAC